jgi:hypothetical protein
MSMSVEIELETRPIERIESDLVVVGYFEDDRPLRGGAARVDWRLCGHLSELLIGGRVTGGVGEAVLMPSIGALRAPRLLLLGLGSRRRFPLSSAEEAMFEATRRGLDLSVARMAVAPLGIASDDIPRHAQALVAGVSRAQEGRSRPLSIALAVPGAEIDRTADALETAMRGLDADAIGLRSPRRMPSPRSADPHGGSPRP